MKKMINIKINYYKFNIYNVLIIAFYLIHALTACLHRRTSTHPEPDIFTYGSTSVHPYPNSSDFVNGTTRISHTLACWANESENLVCLNGGLCQVIRLMNNPRYVFCGCKTGYTGSNCQELFVDPKYWDVVLEWKVKQLLSIFIGVSLVSFVLILAGLCIYCTWRNKRKKLRRKVEERHEEILKQLEIDGDEESFLAIQPQTSKR